LKPARSGRSGASGGKLVYQFEAPRFGDHIQIRLHRDSLAEGTNYRLKLSGKIGEEWLPVDALPFQIRKQ